MNAIKSKRGNETARTLSNRSPVVEQAKVIVGLYVVDVSGTEKLSLLKWIVSVLLLAI